jgi:hypothetical protein
VVPVQIPFDDIADAPVIRLFIRPAIHRNEVCVPIEDALEGRVESPVEGLVVRVGDVERRAMRVRSTMFPAPADIPPVDPLRRVDVR